MATIVDKSTCLAALTAGALALAGCGSGPTRTTTITKTQTVHVFPPPKVPPPKTHTTTVPAPKTQAAQPTTQSQTTTPSIHCTNAAMANGECGTKQQQITQALALCEPGSACYEEALAEENVQTTTHSQSSGCTSEEACSAPNTACEPGTGPGTGTPCYQP